MSLVGLDVYYKISIVMYVFIKSIKIERMTFVYNGVQYG